MIKVECRCPAKAIWHMCQNAEYHGFDTLPYCTDPGWCDLLMANNQVRLLTDWLSPNCSTQVKEEVLGYLAIGIVRNILDRRALNPLAPAISGMLAHALRCHILSPAGKSEFCNLEAKAAENCPNDPILELWPSPVVRYECMYPTTALANGCPNVELLDLDHAPYCRNPSSCGMSLAIGQDNTRWCLCKPESCSDAIWTEVKGYVWVGIARNLLEQQKDDEMMAALSNILYEAKELRSLSTEAHAVYGRLLAKRKKARPNDWTLEYWPNL